MGGFMSVDHSQLKFPRPVKAEAPPETVVPVEEPPADAPPVEEPPADEPANEDEGTEEVSTASVKRTVRTRKAK